jgi:5-methylcytosine-specific restriction protein A
LQRINAGVLHKQPLCVRCLELGRIKLAEVVDHITPLAKEKGPDNPYLPRQGLCRRCHDLKTALDFGLQPKVRFGPDGNPVREDYAGLSTDAQLRRLPVGLPKSAIPLSIVCGPPGSGKSTYVRECMTDRDVLIDLDAIQQELSGKAEHQTEGKEWVRPSLELRNRRLAALASDTQHERAYFIVACPDARERRHWAEMLGGEIVLLDTPLTECIERIKADPLRQDGIHRMIAAAVEWHRINAATI